jgi:flagellin
MNQNKVEGSIQKLSSGLRINGAADDAAGLAISEKMRAQIRGLDQAEANAQDGISLLQTAEGALQQTTDILQRMRELTIKAQNTGVLTEEDRVSISNEMSTLRDEIDRIATSTTFNGKKLLNGDMATKLDDTSLTLQSGVKRINVAGAEASTSYIIEDDDDGTFTLRTVTGGKAIATAKYDNTATTLSGTINFDGIGVSIEIDAMARATAKSSIANTTFTTTNYAGRADFKIGANTFEEDTLNAGIEDMSSKGLNKDMKADEKFTIDISTADKADKTLIAIDYALEKVASQRSKIGTMQNRMEYAISNLSTTSENLSAAESRIRDVDMADEMVKYTKNSILNQSAMAMLAQANQQPQAILSLLQ